MVSPLITSPRAMMMSVVRKLMMRLQIYGISNAPPTLTTLIFSFVAPLLISSSMVFLMYCSTRFSWNTAAIMVMW